MFHLALVSLGLFAAFPGDTPDDASMGYEVLAEMAGRDAGAHVRLASWCDAHGRPAERRKHLLIAVEIAPNHAAVRGLLGEIADKGVWRKPEELVAEFSSDNELAPTLGRYHAAPREDSQYRRSTLATGRVV